MILKVILISGLVSFLQAAGPAGDDGEGGSRPSTPTERGCAPVYITPEHLTGKIDYANDPCYIAAIQLNVADFRAALPKACYDIKVASRNILNSSFMNNLPTDTQFTQPQLLENVYKLYIWWKTKDVLLNEGAEEEDLDPPTFAFDINFMEVRKNILKPIIEMLYLLDAAGA